MDAHQTKTDLSRTVGRRTDLRDREDVFGDDGIEEPDTHSGHVVESFVVDPVGSDELCQVDTAENAGFEGKKRLFAAGVGGVDIPKAGGGIFLIDRIVEEDAWFAVLPDSFDDALPDLSDGYFCTVGAGHPDLVRFAVYDQVHERVRDHDRDIEVAEVTFFGFAFDELHDVGMPDVQNTHVCPAASAALFDDIGGGIEDPHKRDRTGCYAVC